MERARPSGCGRAAFPATLGGVPDGAAPGTYNNVAALVDWSAPADPDDADRDRRSILLCSGAAAYTDTLDLDGDDTVDVAATTTTTYIDRDHDGKVDEVFENTITRTDVDGDGDLDLLVANPDGAHNIAAWAVFATSGTSGMAVGINSSINPPTGRTFDSVFPGYPMATVRSNTAALWTGAYNVQPAYYLFDYVLTNEDTIKTDLPTGTLTVYAFDNAVSIGTATIGPGAACYPNCDSSTVAPILNVNDFSCFLNKFAAGDPYANCDGSTTAPVLNVNDFSCFLNRFAAGCP